METKSGVGHVILEQLRDWVAFFKYGSMLLAMLLTLLLWIFLGYLVISYAYSSGGQIAGLVMTAAFILLSIAAGRRISSL